MKTSSALLASSVLFAAALVSGGCGTSTEGSRYNAQHGVAKDSGYPWGAKQQDPESPALSALSKEEKAVEEKPFTPPNAPAGEAASERSSGKETAKKPE